MTSTQSPPSSQRPAWSSASGLRIELEAHGALRTLALDEVTLNLFVGNALEGGPANLALRLHTSTGVQSTLLLGPKAPTRWHTDPASGRFEGAGVWRALGYRLSLRLAADVPAWFWHVHVENAGADPARVDLMLWQDIGLAPYAAIRMNEYYVSQYVDHTPLAHPQRGVVVASRQNQGVGTRHPWCLIGSLNHAVRFGTDALQVQGLAARAGAPAPALADGLPGVRLQHEHAMVALQDRPCDVAPGTSVDLGWFGRLLADHPEPSSAGDLDLVDQTLAVPEARPPAWEVDRFMVAPAPSLFSTAPLLQALPLSDAELKTVFGTERRHPEHAADGRLLSFFHDADAHVALHAKEAEVLRPHGQVLRTGSVDVPNERALTSTVWMGGVFHSMLTQGHVSINRCLSTVRSYLGLFRSQGVRVFVEMAGGWQLLDQPSAFEMRPDACRWIYRHASGRIEVTSRAHADPHAFGLEVAIVEGPATRCLVCLHVALNGDDGATPGAVQWSAEGTAFHLVPVAGSELASRFPQGYFELAPDGATRVDRVAGDEALFLDGLSRELPYLTLSTAASSAARFMLRGHFVVDGPDVPAADAPGPAAARLALRSRGEAPSGSPAAAALGGVTELLPWLAQNALVHYLAPRGLEQFSGGGWGTRDVCQGPMEYLLAQGQDAAMRDLLLRVMKAQGPDGDWPQWFMFFERDAGIRADDSNGDIVFWPLLALGQYLIATADASILDAPVAFYGSPGAAAPGTPIPALWTHVARALKLIERRTVAGTALAAYGHGDWNDALQPVDPAMRENMCSAWTVVLHHQTLTTLARGLRAVGRATVAARLDRAAVAVQADWRRLLLVDGVLCGYARFEGEGEAARISYLLHPRDDATGVHYSLLAMSLAIIEGLFDPAEMRAHLRLVERHLTGPDGARLFDKPMSYQGGTQRHFQRAESATFFGREIGLMYMHAHLRHAQALAHVGDAEAFFRSLRQASPIGLQAIVPSASRRPSNAYYSSSDAAFDDRYQASADYERVGLGSIALEGGWRVYSSGAGILYGLIVRQLYGLRLEADALLIDPVMPVALDGTRLIVRLRQTVLEIFYRVAAPGFGVEALQSGTLSLAFVEDANPYRRGAARVRLDDLVGEGGADTPVRLTVYVGSPPPTVVRPSLD